MSQNNIDELKKNIIALGRLLWEKDLTVGLSGNLSLRIDAGNFLITATRTCLGLLREDDIVSMHVSGECQDDSRPSSEWRLHSAIYQAFEHVKAIAHIHSLYTNAFFLKNNVLRPKIIEAKHVLGEVASIPQETLNVEDPVPVVKTLTNKNLAVLQKHGSLAIGNNLFECFILLQTLEEAARIEIINGAYS
ncbi:MAG: class II aldolase/adducin family protein [Candidatus Omnitrophota bacterium]